MSAERELRRLAADMDEVERQPRTYRRKGTVSALSVSGLLTVRLGGRDVPVRHLEGDYQVGDAVSVLMDAGGNSGIVIGRHDTGVPRLVAGVITDTVDSSGYLTWAHDLDAIPSAVLVSGRAPISGGVGPAMPITDSYTTTTARTRWWGQSGGNLSSISVTFSFVALR